MASDLKSLWHCLTTSGAPSSENKELSRGILVYIIYRVIQQVSDLGWVDFDLDLEL